MGSWAIPTWNSARETIEDSPACSRFADRKIGLFVSGYGRVRLTPSLTNWSLKWRRSPTASRRSIDRTVLSAIHTAELTMTGHRNRHIDIELQILFDCMVNGERVVCCTIQEFSQIILYISVSYVLESRRTNTNKKIKEPTRAVKTPPLRD